MIFMEVYIMAEWKYRLEFEGKSLRQLINKEETMENIIAIYNQIILCLEHLNNRLRGDDKEEYEYDIESMIDDLQCACPNIEDNNGYDEEQDNLNYYLKDFYDMCDNARVWIGI